MTKGETRIRTNFNVSGSGQVDRIKHAAADLIDLIEALPDGAETTRLKDLAQTAIEQGAMWAVKAATGGNA